MEKVSPLFQLFEKRYTEARLLFAALAKNFRSKKAIELEEHLIFINVYLHLLNKIHFNEERLKFEAFDAFKPLSKALSRIRHYKAAGVAFDEERTSVPYNTYENFLKIEKKELYKAVYEVVISQPPDIWEELYASASEHSKGIKPLMADTATNQLVDEELEFINFEEDEDLDSQAIKDIMEGLRTITVVENIKIAVGLNPVFIEEIHREMKVLLQTLVKWNQTYFLAQHFNYFLSDHEHVGKKYIELARRIKDKKKRLTTEVASLSNELFSKFAA